MMIILMTCLLQWSFILGLLDETVYMYIQYMYLPYCVLLTVAVENISLYYVSKDLC